MLKSPLNFYYYCGLHLPTNTRIGWDTLSL
nr:MAG TPA: aminopeptidase [Caudoviricetes sp.]